MSINNFCISSNNVFKHFIQHFGRQYFYGLNDSTLYSCLLSLIKKDENGQLYLTNIRQNYSQLTIKSKSFVEQNTGNNEECFLSTIILFGN